MISCACSCEKNMRALETKVGHYRFVYVFVSKHICIVGVVLHTKELLGMNHKLLKTTKNATLVLFYGRNMFVMDNIVLMDHIT